jgi:hypothetical protein
MTPKFSGHFRTLVVSIVLLAPGACATIPKGHLVIAAIAIFAAIGTIVYLTSLAGRPSLDTRRHG